MDNVKPNPRAQLVSFWEGRITRLLKIRDHLSTRALVKVIDRDSRTWTGADKLLAEQTRARAAAAVSHLKRTWGTGR